MECVFLIPAETSIVLMNALLAVAHLHLIIDILVLMEVVLQILMERISACRLVVLIVLLLALQTDSLVSMDLVMLTPVEIMLPMDLVLALVLLFHLITDMLA